MKYTYEQIIEKLVRAKEVLASLRQYHSGSCPVEWDPDGFAPCNCGATAANTRINAMLRELDL